MMSKETSAQLVNQYIKLFQCPLCQQQMRVEQSKSLVCTNNHTFDFAKQGYLNLLSRAVNGNYDKTLFASRRRIILESGLYTRLHEKLVDIIQNSFNFSNDGSSVIYDAGCGEGSHLHQILNHCQPNLIGVGLDIAKEGIRMASSRYKESIWLVADLARSPLVDHSCQVIINILSPANYQDFKRILAPDGIVLKVVPRAGYLMELREALYEDKSYQNDDTVSLFKEHFELLDVVTMTYTVMLNEENLSHLVQMSPLSWNASEEAVDSFLNRSASKITVDLDILIGR